MRLAAGAALGLLALPLAAQPPVDHDAHPRPEDHAAPANGSEEHAGHEGMDHGAHHAGREKMDHGGEHHGHAGMSLDAGGMVMHENHDRLPAGCDRIREEIELTVEAGTEFAVHPGTIFGLSAHEYRVPPCSRLQVTFINRDEVRHQWMVHGLPRTIHPGGMFHLEAAGGHRVSGTFITPAEDRTYLVHCDLAQHMEKGMKAQLEVGRGSGDLWSVPGVSRGYRRDDYAPAWAGAALLTALLAGLALSRLPWPGRRHRRPRPPS